MSRAPPVAPRPPAPNVELHPRGRTVDPLAYLAGRIKDRTAGLVEVSVGALRHAAKAALAKTPGDDKAKAFAAVDAHDHEQAFVAAKDVRHLLDVIADTAPPVSA